jgi:hypothetical protein
MFKSSTQKSVTLLVCEAEQTAGVLCAQDMMYVWNVLESMGLKVKLHMTLEMNTKGAVDLVNNWSIGGCTRHVDVRQCFLWELKESKVMDIKWIKGPENDANAFTKNLDGPAFENCVKTLVRQDVHMRKSPLLSREGVRRKPKVLRRVPRILIKKRFCRMQTYFIFLSRSSL